MVVGRPRVRLSVWFRYRIVAIACGDATWKTWNTRTMLFLFLYIFSIWPFASTCKVEKQWALPAPEGWNKNNDWEACGACVVWWVGSNLCVPRRVSICIGVTNKVGSHTHTLNVLVSLFTKPNESSSQMTRAANTKQKNKFARERKRNESMNDNIGSIY